MVWTGVGVSLEFYDTVAYTELPLGDPDPLSLISPVTRCSLLNFLLVPTSENARSQFQVLTPCGLGAV